MPEYVELELRNQISLLRRAKMREKCTWQILASRLGVNRSMVFFYLSGSRISKPRFLKLCRLARVAPNKYAYRIVPIREKQISEPHLNPDLANFLGILAGDGHMNLVSYEVTITGHKTLDRKFIETHVMPMLEGLFGIKPYMRIYEHCMICRAYSKRLVHYLMRTFKLPAGKKKGRLRIPKEILGDDELLRAYIRGLYDTDGSVYRHHEKSIAIDITSSDMTFRNDILNGLTRLGFHPTMNGKNIQIYRKNEIDDFFKIISPNNERHLNRYKTYKKLGYLPSAKEIMRL